MKYLNLLFVIAVWLVFNNPILDLRAFLFNSNKIQESEIELEYGFDYNVLFDAYNLTQSLFFGMPLVSSILGKSTIFQSFADHIFVTNDSILEVKNIKCGDIIFVKTDFIHQFFKRYHLGIKNPYILITHSSDYSVGDETWQIDYLNENKIIKWFAQNVNAKHPKLGPLPIGVYVPLNETFSTLHKLIKQPIPFKEKKYFLFINFSPDTNENRSAVLRHFKTVFEKNKNVFFDENRSSWMSYMQNLKNSQFVLSPAGNGIDCHRTWEALAIGAVPIVLKTDLQPLYDGMPVMVVDEWAEVTQTKMKRFQKEVLSHRSKDGIPWKPKFWLRYWINKIMVVKNEYLKNNCSQI